VEDRLPNLQRWPGLLKEIAGSCIDYVRNITVKLSELEIDDPAVDEIARALRQ
jgi:hypothetical protein